MTRYGAALAVLAIFAKARAKGNGTNECEYTTNRVHNGRTGEVVECIAEGVHHETAFLTVAKPAATPCPMSRYRIDEQRDEK